ncbi:hypothetical protein MBLNU230_g0968t1 [Neophaeotheca triangularis]
MDSQSVKPTEAGMATKRKAEPDTLATAEHTLEKRIRYEEASNESDLALLPDRDGDRDGDRALQEDAASAITSNIDEANASEEEDTFEDAVEEIPTVSGPSATTQLYHHDGQNEAGSETDMTLADAERFVQVGGGENDDAEDGEYATINGERLRFNNSDPSSAEHGSSGGSGADDPIIVDDDSEDGSGDSDDSDDMFKAAFRNGKKKTGEESGAKADLTPAEDSDGEDGNNNTKPAIKTKSDKKPPKSLKPVTVPQTDPKHPRGPMLKDIPSRLRNHNAFHKRSVALIPSIYLAPHRYWIGVLNRVTKAGKHAASPEDYVWMRGNRLITTRTVWHMFSQRSAETEFVLLHGPHASYGQEDLEQMECLDLFNDKKIMFKAVPAGASEALVERLAATPPVVQQSEVITLDDD